MRHSFKIKGAIGAFFLVGFLSFQTTCFERKSVERIESSHAPLNTSFTNAVGMAFVYVPPGTFLMGSPVDDPGRDADEPQHNVTLTKGFYMQTTEVTQNQWRTVMGNSPSYFKGCGADCPVEQVSWDDCQDFVMRLNSLEKTDKYRLPTEAEWEYACRAGSITAFANGRITERECGHEPKLDEMGWYCGNSGNTPHPVAQKKPNAWGLYDMHGNVWEWCEDRSDYQGKSVVTNSYTDSVVDPRGVIGDGRVNRGGAWTSYARFCRCSFRNRGDPDSRKNTLGFRLARNS